jgi:CcmD family protein
MDTFAYLFAAYAAVWVVLFVYVASLHRREKRLWQEIELLRERLAPPAQAPSS